MNKIIKKLLLAGEKCMPESHLGQPGFTYSAGGPFTKHSKGFRNSEKWVV